MAKLPRGAKAQNRTDPQLTLGAVLTGLEKLKAYNFYNENYDLSFAMGFLADHFSSLGEDKFAVASKIYTGQSIPPTIGFLCRMKDLGVVFDDDSKKYYEDRMAKARTILQNIADTAVAAYVRSETKSKADGPKFLEASEELKLTSIPWRRVKKFTELWTYNVKTRVLSVYRSEGTLDIKGSTIKNVTFSTSKKIRKPESIFPGFASLSRAKTESAFAMINSQGRKVSPRLNEDTILLSVF